MIDNRQARACFHRVPPFCRPILNFSRLASWSVAIACGLITPPAWTGGSAPVCGDWAAADLHDVGQMFSLPTVEKPRTPRSERPLVLLPDAAGRIASLNRPRLRAEVDLPVSPDGAAALRREVLAATVLLL